MKQLRTFLKFALFKALLLTPVAAHAILGGGAGEFIENGTSLQDADFYVNTGKINGNFEVVGSTALFRSTMTLSGARPVAMTAPLSGQVLKWNGSSWAPGTDNAGAGTTLAVKQDNSIFDAAVSTFDFASADFSMTSSPSGEVNFTLVATNPKFVQNRDTLQVGATSYVFNSTVDGFLTVISSYTAGQQFPVRFQGRAPPATNLSFPLGFYFLNSTNALEEFAAIDAVTREVTTNTVNGKLRFKIASDSVEKTMLEMSSESTEDYVAFPTTNRVYFGTNQSTGAYVKSSGSNLILSPGQNDGDRVTLQPASSGISYSNGATGGLVVINKGTSGAHDGMVVISSQATQGSIDSLAHLVSLTTSYNEIMLWIQSNSASAIGANADIRIDSLNPDIELQELDQLSAGTGNGKWEIAVNFDQLQFNQRNATDSSFQTLVALARDGSMRFKELDNGGDFVGFIATNTLSTSFVYKLPSDNPAEGASLHTHAFAGGYYDMYWTKDVQNTNTLQSGTTFFVSAGRITSPLGSGATTFIVTQNDTSAQAIRVLSTGTANAVYVEDDGDAGSGSGSSGAVFINNTFNPGIALQIYSNNANPTSNAGMVFFKYANTAATKPLLRLDNFGTGPSLKIVENGNKGNTLSTSGSILVDNTQNPGIGIQVYSSTGSATGALLHLMADSTTWSSPIAVFESTSANSTAINLRLKDQNPDLEFQEIDQTTPAGKFKIDVQSDQMRFLARNGADNAYEMFAKFNPIRTGMFLELESTGTLRFNSADNSRYVQLKASNTVVNNLTFVLPAADGTSGQALVTDGAGNLSFTTISGGGGTPGGSQGNIQINNASAFYGSSNLSISTVTPRILTYWTEGQTSFGGQSSTMTITLNNNSFGPNSTFRHESPSTQTGLSFVAASGSRQSTFSINPSNNGSGYIFALTNDNYLVPQFMFSDNGYAVVRSSGNADTQSPGNVGAVWGIGGSKDQPGKTILRVYNDSTDLSFAPTDLFVVNDTSATTSVTSVLNGATYLRGGVSEGYTITESRSNTQGLIINSNLGTSDNNANLELHNTGSSTFSGDNAIGFFNPNTQVARINGQCLSCSGGSEGGDLQFYIATSGSLPVTPQMRLTYNNGLILNTQITPNTGATLTIGSGGTRNDYGFVFNAQNLTGTFLYTSSGLTDAASLFSMDRRLSVTGSVTASRGIITSTGVFTSLSPGVMHIVATSSNVATGLVSLSTEVTGTLPVTNGGLGFATATQGDIIYSDASNSLAKLAKDTNATRYLSNTGTSNNPAWAQVDLSNGVTGTLSDSSLSSQVDLLNSTQTASAQKLFKDVVVQSTFTVNRSTVIINGTTYYWPATITNNRLLRHSSGGTLAWSQADLTTDVTGTLPAGNLPATVAYTDSANTFTKSQTVSGGGISASTVAVGGLYINPNIKTANYTVTSTDTIIVASGTITITFPSLTSGTSQQVIVSKVNLSTQPVTLAVGSLVAGTTTTFYLYAPGQSMWMYSDGTNWSPIKYPKTQMYVGYPDDPNSAATVVASTTYCRQGSVDDFVGITDVRVNVGAQALQSAVAVYQDGVRISSSNFTTIGTGKVTIPLNTVAYLHPGVAWVCFGSQSATTTVTRASASTSALGVCSFATTLPYPATQTFAGCTAAAAAYSISGLVGGGGAAP